MSDQINDRHSDAPHIDDPYTTETHFTDSARIVAVLLTDVVSSTQHLVHLGDEAGNAQRVRHFELLRGCLDLHAGHEVKNTGDGLLAVFPSAVDAVHCATAMQQLVDHDRQLHPHDGVQMKVGLHIGEPVQDERDFFGAPMVIVTRLCSAAAPGQIVASELLRTLVASKHELRFEPLGELDLKGIATPMRAYSVPWRTADATAAGAPDTIDAPDETAETAESAESAEPPGDTTPYRSPLSMVEGRARFVDRAREQARLASWFERAARGRRTVGFVAGEPGVGKTRLVAEAAEDAHRLGAVVLWGRCFEESYLPHGAFVEALRGVVDQARPGGALHPLDAAARRLCAVAPIFAPDGSADRDAPRVSQDPGADRLRFFDAVDAMITGLCALAPVVLVLDDLQWADEETLLLLTHLARSPERDRLLVLGTYRDNEIDRSRPLAARLAELRRDHHDERIRLRGLPEPAVDELIDDLAHGSLAPEVREAIVAQTDGNPFFVEEVVAHLVETGATDARAVLPEGVREVIGRRLSDLSDATNEILTVAAVIGREFTLSTVEQILEMDRDVAVDALDEALRAGLVGEVAGTPGRYAFLHGLVRETLEAELSATRVARLHQRIAEHLERALAMRPERVDATATAELAHHALAAVPLGDPYRAVQHARAAGDQALSQMSYERAATLFGAALDTLDGVGGVDGLDGVDPASVRELAARVQLGAGTAQVLAGDGPTARASFHECLDAAELLDDPELHARAALGLGTAIGSGVGFEFGVFNQELADALERSLERLDPGDSRLRALVGARLGSAHGFSQDPLRGVQLCRDAVAMAERLGDPVTLARCLNDLRAAAWSRVTPAEQEALSARIVELAAEHDEPIIELQGRVWLVCDAMERGDDVAAVEAVLAPLTQLVERLRLPQYRWYLELHRSCRALLDGDADLAEQAALTALEVGSGMGELNVELAVGASTYLQFLERDRTAELVELAAEQVERFPGLLAWRAVLAQTLAARGDRCTATKTLLLALEELSDAPPDPLRPVTLALLIDAAQRLADVHAADALHELLSPYAGRQVMVAQMVGSLGAADHHLGVAAATAGRTEEATRHLRAAVDQHRRTGATTWLRRSAALLEELELRAALGTPRGERLATVPA